MPTSSVIVSEFLSSLSDPQKHHQSYKHNNNLKTTAIDNESE